MATGVWRRRDRKLFVGLIDEGECERLAKITAMKRKMAEEPVPSSDGSDQEEAVTYDVADSQSVECVNPHARLSTPPSDMTPVLPLATTPHLKMVGTISVCAPQIGISVREIVARMIVLHMPNPIVHQVVDQHSYNKKRTIWAKCVICTFTIEKDMQTPCCLATMCLNCVRMLANAYLLSVFNGLMLWRYAGSDTYSADMPRDMVAFIADNEVTLIYENIRKMLKDSNCDEQMSQIFKYITPPCVCCGHDVDVRRVRSKDINVVSVNKLNEMSPASREASINYSVQEVNFVKCIWATIVGAMGKDDMMMDAKIRHFLNPC